MENSTKKKFKESMLLPFAKATLTKFLEKEDLNFKLFYEMSPEFISPRQIKLNKFELPTGFSDITHQKFYFKPDKQLREEELNVVDKTQIWSDAMSEITTAIKLNRVHEDDAEIMQDRLATFLSPYYMTSYMYTSQRLTELRENYFSEILIQANRLCPNNSTPHIEVKNMEYRDEIFKQIFPNKSNYKEFFDNYITKKYEFERTDLITTSVLFSIYDNFMSNIRHNGSHKDLICDYNKLNNKLSANNLNNVEKLERELIKNRADVRLYNPKFKEEVYQTYINCNKYNKKI